MVSETELVERLREFLSTSDLNTTTTATVRRKLEEDFGIDLSDKKPFIREQIDLYLQSQLQEAEENEENNGENDEEENGETAEESDGTDGEEEVEASSNGSGAAKRRSVKTYTISVSFLCALFIVVIGVLFLKSLRF